MEEIECREICQKTVRGAVDTTPRKKKSMTQMTTKSRTPHKSASQSPQVRKSILRIPSRGRTRKAGNADSGMTGNGQGKKAARSKSASTSTKQTSKTGGTKLCGWSKKRRGKATASSQMRGDRNNRMRSSSSPLWKRGSTSSDPQTLHFMISRLARLPQKHYSRCWDSGLTSAPPLSAPRSTSTSAWSIWRETYTFRASSQAVRILYLLPTQKSTPGQHGNLMLGTSHLHSSNAFENSARP